MESPPCRWRWGESMGGAVGDVPRIRVMAVLSALSLLVVGTVFVGTAAADEVEKEVDATLWWLRSGLSGGRTATARDRPHVAGHAFVAQPQLGAAKGG